MAYQVKVTLVALEGSLSPAERTFVLDQNRPIIPVGRASKSVSKGLQGAVDNAWFDSPVMSRDHAEISFNADTKTLLIQDIGSMHGTILNGHQMPCNERKEVYEDDMLTFGAEVRRGQESFSACSFKVNYDFQPYKSSNTFAFPDSSDVEDDEDYPFSEEEFIIEHLSSEESLPLGSALPKASQAVNSIDLTREDSPVNPSFDSIDLTGDTPVAGAVEEPVITESQDIGKAEEANDPALGLDPAQSQPENDDSEDGDLSSDSDDDSEVQITERPPSANAYDFEEIEDSDNEDAESIEADETEMFQDSIKAAQDPAATEEYAAYTNATYSNPCIDSTQSLINELVDDEDIELAKVGAEGIRAMMDASLLQDNSSSAYHYNHFQTLFGNEPSTSTDREDHSIMLPSGIQPDMSSSALQVQLPSLTQGLREPSPSDAAMAKPTDLNCFSNFYLQQKSAQALGEKSGKEEFFKARERNKEMLREKEAGTQVVPGCAFTLDRQHPAESQAALLPLDRPIKACVGKLSKVGTLETVVGEGSSKDYTSFNPQSSLYYAPLPLQSLLDFPDLETSKCPAPSPSFDMTSAVKYNESKASMKRPDNFTPQSCNARSGLRIDEIIDTDSLEQGQISLKRKSDAISDVVQDEVRMWASIYKPENKLSAAPPAPIAHSNTKPSNAQTDVSQDQQQRPTKRLKKIMENVAYIALGGVTVGAALFGGLVATAPDFI